MIRPFYTYEVGEGDEVVVMDFNSLVDVPAHMKPFVTFRNQRAHLSQTEKFGKAISTYRVANEEERIVMGVLISADTPIFRRDDDGEYYGIFRKDTITKIKERLMRQGHMHNLNTMHDGSQVVQGAFMTEIFQVDAKKGIPVPGALKDQNIRDGSLIGSYKIIDDKVWSDVKSGKYRGFSIEAYLDIKPAQLKKANMKGKNKTPIKSLWARLKASAEALVEGAEVTAEFEQATDMDNVIYKWEGDLAEGTPIFVEVEGEDVPAPEGDYQLTMADGTVKMVSVDASGLVLAVVDPTDMTAAEVLEEIAEVMNKKFSFYNKLVTDLKTEVDSLKTELGTLKTGGDPEKFKGDPLKGTGKDGDMTTSEILKHAKKLGK